ncbi:response regulator [Arcobacter sp. YIC-310]|uniref:response regulator n=1 Tax=Arcobacter sp. YIC-310 TaxID=3376632 RepID=UPI003C1626F3
MDFEDITILLVDDNLEHIKLLSEILNKYFKNVIEANNGKTAYELYKKNPNIDIIISDIEMPEVNGLELLRLVRLSDLYVPFIITSASIDSKTLLKAIDLNVNSILTKPVDMKKLLEKVDILREKKLFEKRFEQKRLEIKNYIKAVDKVALIYKMNDNGDITYMNEGMLDVSKYTKEEIKNINFNDLIHPDIPKKHIEETWHDIREDKLWKGNTKFISKDDEVFYLNNTIFKIRNIDDSIEYITIAFLTTQENLKKRDFQKKVLLNIKEANRKEFSLKKEIDQLRNELFMLRASVSDNSQSNLDVLTNKIKSKEKQIASYEEQITELNNKYNNMLVSKKQEVEHHVNSIQSFKIKIDMLKNDLAVKSEELDVTHGKIKEYQNNLDKKDKIIKDLRFIIEQMEEEKN